MEQKVTGEDAETEEEEAWRWWMKSWWPGKRKIVLFAYFNLKNMMLNRQPTCLVITFFRVFNGTSLSVALPSAHCTGFGCKEGNRPCWRGRSDSEPRPTSSEEGDNSLADRQPHQGPDVSGKSKSISPLDLPQSQGLCSHMPLISRKYCTL